MPKFKKPAIARKKKAKSQKNKQIQRLPSSFVVLWRSFKVPKPVRKYIFGLLLLHTIAVVFFLNPDNTFGNSALLGFLVSVVVGMAYIWFFREAMQKNPNPTYAAAFYGGTAQIVPFSLLLLLASVQILPFAIGAWVFQIGVGGGIAVHIWEQIAFAVGWFILATPSMYWLSATLLGLVVVTIYGVRPREAWRAGRKLVRGYVLQFVWRISFLIIIMISFAVVAVLGAISVDRIVFASNIPGYATPAAIALFWAYTFQLYQELIAREE